MSSVECEDCGQCFEPFGYSSDICPECEAEHAARHLEEQRERELDNAHSCRCGAWGIGKNGNVYHAADCVCGQT